MHRVINICASVTALRRSSRARRRNNCILKDAIIARRINCILEKCRCFKTAVSPASSAARFGRAAEKTAGRRNLSTAAALRTLCRNVPVAGGRLIPTGGWLSLPGTCARCLCTCMSVHPAPNSTRTQRRRLPGCCMSVHVYVSLCTPRPTQRLRLGAGAGHYGVPGLPPPCGLYQGARRQVGHEQLHPLYLQLHLGHPALELCCQLVRLTALVLHSQLRTLHQG